MRFSRIMAIVSGLSLMAVSVMAQVGADASSAGNWSFNAGVSYRNFRDARFTGVNTGNYVGLFQDSAANMGDFATEIKNYMGDDPVPVSVVTYTGGTAKSSGDYGFQESLGIILGTSLGLWRDGRVGLDFVANFQCFQVDSAGYGGAGSEYTTNVFAAGGEVSYNDVSESTSYIGAISKTKFDMDLYVIDLGLALDYSFENGLGLYVATGPTLSLADMESNSRAGLYNTAAGNSPLGSARGRANEHEFEWGWYAAAGASYWFSENVGLACELRYDEGFGTVGTKYVVQDLDAWGGNLKLLFRF
ncbi:MAG: hypothetical protein ACOX6W_07660 [Lentisphaeria bacterium]|jgi:hypothetical protein